MSKKKLDRNKSILLACSLILGTSLLIFTPFAHADGPYKKPDIYYKLSETPIWNSNPLMRRQGVEGIYGTETKGFLGFQRELISTKIRADVAAARYQYAQSEFNSTDLYARTRIEHSLQRLMLAITGNYDHDTTRSSEITTFGQDVGTGRRDSFTIHPSVLYMISPRAALGIEGEWQETRYEYPTLTDYSVMTLMPTFRYNLTPLQIATITFQGRRFTILENTDQYIDSFGPYLSWSYNFRPEWTLSLSLGVLGSKSYGFSGGNGKQNYSMTYGSSLRYNGLRSVVDFSITKALQSYANGTESYLTTFEANEKYTINPNLAFTLKGSYQTADQPPQALYNLERAWNGGASLDYQIGPNWNVNAAYKYRQEKLTGVSDEAKQQIVRMGLTYQFGK